MLVESITIRTCFLSVGGKSPYRYCRTQNLMSSTEDLSLAQLVDYIDSQGMIAARACQTAFQSMVEETARRRGTLAEQIGTRLAPEQLQLLDGDLVGIYHNLLHKNNPEWRDPTSVVDFTSEIIAHRIGKTGQARHPTMIIYELSRATVFAILMWDHHYGLMHSTSLRTFEDVAASFTCSCVHLDWIHSLSEHALNRDITRWLF